MRTALVIKITAWIALGAGALVFVQGSREAWHAHEVGAWDLAEGEVILAEQSARGTHHRIGSLRRHEPRWVVAYSYDYAGSRRQGREAVSEKDLSALKGAGADGYNRGGFTASPRQGLPMGQKLSVRVDPGDPAVSTLSGGG